MKKEKKVKEIQAQVLVVKLLNIASSAGFAFLSGINRIIIPSHVTSMAESILKIGIIRPVVVANISFISGKMMKYIIDGQHLFHACLRLGINIPYVEIEIKDKADLIEKIALLNSSSKSWMLKDYIVAWGSLKEDYVKLNKCFETYDIELGVLANILSGDCPQSAAGGSSISKSIKKGTFKVVDEEKNMEIINNLTDVLSVLNRQTRVENKYLCSEYVSFVRATANYNHDKFMKNLEKNKSRFELATQENGKLHKIFQKLV